MGCLDSLAGLRGCQCSSAHAGEDVVLLYRSVVVLAMETNGHSWPSSRTAWPRLSLCLHLSAELHLLFPINFVCLLWRNTEL